jgi:cytochrome c-type biogenesis protein
MLHILFAYLAGLATLLNPCVLPLLPIVAASALQDTRYGPLFLAAGLGAASTLVGFLLTVFGTVIGLDQQALTQLGAVLLIIFGTLMLLPARLSPFAAMTGVAARAQGLSMRLAGSPAANFGAGAALGVAWSPCIGPTMGAAIALAATGQNLAWAGAIMAAYGLGIASLMIALAYGGRAVVMRRKGRLQALAPMAMRLFAVTAIGLGLMLITHAHIALEIWLIGIMPDWLLALSTAV